MLFTYKYLTQCFKECPKYSETLYKNNLRAFETKPITRLQNND